MAFCSHESGMQHTPSNELYIGLMSGTSLDGVDAALIDFAGLQPQLVATHFRPYPKALVDTLLGLHHAFSGELDQSQKTAQQLSALYAQTVLELLQNSHHQAQNIRAIGNHGQTVRHCPEAGYTLQLANNALLAELSDIDVIGDFRARDIAAGGQGAPLVPAFHSAVFGNSEINRVILNIGGIANVSYLPRTGAVFGFDTGPGNLLMDSWIRLHQGQPMDKDGQWAASGKVLPDLLKKLSGHSYFELPPPKSTGRDLFHLQWLQQQLTPDMAAVDVQATLLAFSVTSIANAIQRFCSPCDEIYVCGGGARNTAMMHELQQQLPHCLISSTETLGIHPDWVEAAAFAWLARQFVLRQAGNLPAVTGARGPRVLGALYPA